MFYIGCHLSSSKGYLAMAKEAVRIGANTFSFFTRNPRGGAAKQIDEADVAEFLNYTKEHGFGKLVAHAPYTLNACSADEGLRRFAQETMADDLARMEYTPDNYYNFHPGSHVKQGVDVGIEYIAEALNINLKPEQTTIVLLETMAGKGSEIGRSFEEIKAIIDKVELKNKLGVCLDTCHVFDGGYDIVNKLEAVLEEFDRVIGLDMLRAIHLNDSMNSLGSQKDRHAKLGEGQIGFDALVKIINHPRLRTLPFILETPNDNEGYKEEIRRLKEAYIE
jgi:deoxyribonuclease-4